MTPRAPSWWLKPGIGRKVAITMALAVMAVQAQAFLQVWLFADPEIRLVGAKWLVERSQAAAGILDKPAGDRAAAAGALSHNGLISFRWTASAADLGQDMSDRPELSRLAATVRARLDLSPEAVRVWSTRLDYMFPISNVRVVVQPASLLEPPSRAVINAHDPDVFVPAAVRIAIQGRDGTWVVVAPVGFEENGSVPGLPLLPLVAGALIIAMASIASTRRIMAPLDRLVAAAAQVGQSRSFVPIEKSGLAEFTGVAQAIEEMQCRLLRFVNERTEILAAISHDLRTALARLRILAERQGHGSKAAGMLDEIRDMEGMLDSTLAFAGGEANQSPDRLVDVASLLISLVDDTSDLGRPCSYEGPDHAMAVGHPLSLKRAFSNLIDNAIKYGGAARVHLACDADRILIRVEDDGPGIPDDRREEALAPFKRLDRSRSGAVPGAGLGLTIARDVVRSHGGDLTLGSGEERGLRVLVILPDVKHGRQS
jgi:signal transduction histidine kinase